MQARGKSNEEQAVRACTCCCTVTMACVFFNCCPTMQGPLAGWVCRTGEGILGAAVGMEAGHVFSAVIAPPKYQAMASAPRLHSH